MLCAPKIKKARTKANNDYGTKNYRSKFKVEFKLEAAIQWMKHKEELNWFYQILTVIEHLHHISVLRI